MTYKRLQLIWEVLARSRVSADRAVLLMESQCVTVTAEEAQHQLDEAGSRNTLRLINTRADYLQSNWMRCRVDL